MCYNSNEKGYVGLYGFGGKKDMGVWEGGLNCSMDGPMVELSLFLPAHLLIPEEKQDPGKGPRLGGYRAIPVYVPPLTSPLVSSSLTVNPWSSHGAGDSVGRDSRGSPANSSPVTSDVVMNLQW